MNLPETLQEALSRPVGARFRRSALQVNPYPYLQRRGRGKDYAGADAYNSALVDELVANDVELIGITDHDRSDDAGLRDAAGRAGIIAFPGTEVCSSDGIHILVLFDPATTAEKIDLFLGWCQVNRSDSEYRPCGRTLTDILEEAQRRRAVTVLPHVVTKKGLFAEMSGQPLVNVWRSPHLTAIAIPGQVKDLNLRERRIVEGKDDNYRRDFPIAAINANDISGPDEVHGRAWTWIKAASDTIEGLRQAFLDPESRVRLSSDPDPTEHSELVAIGWDGGFLDGCRLRLNENLNVLIGGRGTGKSTVIESIRYVTGREPVGADAASEHNGIVDEVLGPGTTISLLVRSIRPDHHHYVIQRTVPEPPVVNDEDGTRLPIEPKDVLEHLEIYGQHEIAELARDRAGRTALLDRFVDRSPAVDTDRARVKRELARNREQIVALLRELSDLDADLARLPALEERLSRFEEAGVEERLQVQANFTREGAILDRVEGIVDELAADVDEVDERADLDRTFLQAKAVEDLPSQDLLAKTNEILEALQQTLRKDLARARKTIKQTRNSLQGIRATWTKRRDQAEADYQEALQSLGRESAEARTFVELRRTIEQLRPLKGRRERVQKALTAAREERSNYLEGLSGLTEQRASAYAKAAKRVSRELQDLVRVSFQADADRRELVEFLRDAVGGRLDLVQSAIEEKDQLSLIVLAEACRKGPEAVHEYLEDVSAHQAERVCNGLDEEALMKLEEVTMGPALDLELNVASSGPARWREVERLSTGQKATAILLLLLLESDEPLIVDQPEDDLDNEFISEGIVPRIREAKRQRQFLFSTHNANVPVLGDAELIAVLRASGEPGTGQGRIDRDETGSIDSSDVRELVEQLLEGGHAAFETRRRKYRF